MSRPYNKSLNRTPGSIAVRSGSWRRRLVQSLGVITERASSGELVRYRLPHLCRWRFSGIPSRELVGPPVPPAVDFSRRGAGRILSPAVALEDRFHLGRVRLGLPSRVPPARDPCVHQSLSLRMASSRGHWIVFRSRCVIHVHRVHTSLPQV